MTSIYGVDATQQPWSQQSDRHPTAKDFAHELAKRDEQAKSDLPGNAKASAEAEPGAQSSAASIKAGELAVTGPETASAQIEALATAKAQQAAQAVVTPVGITEALLGARVFGWHAMAQSYLSELVAADEASTMPSSSGQQASASFDASVQATSASPPNEAEIAATDTASADLPVTSMSLMQASMATDDVASANTAALSDSDASAPANWSERSLRFTRQRDGTRVAWLRDFRITDAEASHLIQWVVNDAKAKGLVLSKVMLNGREAWTSRGVQ
jgi:hypothetical protein